MSSLWWIPVPFWCHSCGVLWILVSPVDSGPTPADSGPTPVDSSPTPVESCDSYRNGGGTEKYCLWTAALLPNVRSKLTANDYHRWQKWSEMLEKEWSIGDVEYTFQISRSLCCRRRRRWRESTLMMVVGCWHGHVPNVEHGEHLCAFTVYSVSSLFLLHSFPFLWPMPL